MSLKEYKEKRNFEATSEPEGKHNEEGSPVLHFVVQKHNASHLHYDFRLELNGVLKSWAVPKGPSMNPSDKRLAMMVEDHPFEYRKFEGTIPKGEYGGGEVIIWDEGIYSSTETTDARESEKHLNAGLKKGHLSLVLQGEKLKGVFDLVKIKGQNTKEDNTWLLIKRPDPFSSNEEILNNEISVVSGRSIEDLKNSSNKYSEKLNEIISLAPESEMPHEIQPMLAGTVEEPFNRPGWIFEIKWDGYRAIAEIQNGNIKLYSRNRISFLERFPEIAGELKKISGDCVLDGEVVVVNEKGEPDFQLLQNFPEEKKGILAYYVFDILYLNGRDLRSMSLINRKILLKDFLPELLRVKYSDHISDEGIAFFDLAVKGGLEGIIGKDENSPYREGRRTEEWLKIKKFKREEAIIGGFTEPRGGRFNLGALILGKYDNGKLKYIGHTGGGFSDEKLKEMRIRLEKLEIKSSPFEEAPETNAKAHWVEPKLVCEVNFANWTKEGHLRQPIFVGLREDKHPGEVTFEKQEPVERIFRTDIKEKEKIFINGKELIISNPNKVYWPEDAYTKKDLIEYYQKISNFILPYLQDRPESMLRHPHGIYGESFYQKNVEDSPDWIEIFPFRSDSEEREIKYLVCNDLPTLIFMVNLGCIEINPWSSRIFEPDNPDYMIIDLDPEDISFDYVVEAALETKKVLDEMGIPSFCKTSGKTGMHILVPMGARYAYEQVKNFCELIVRIVHRRIPEHTSIERSPLKRQRKVYLDFLQNRRGQTISAPYSVRPVKGALISTPLNWDEIKPGINPAIYNIRTIHERLARVGDLWKPVLGEGIDLGSVLNKMKI